VIFGTLACTFPIFGVSMPKGRSSSIRFSDVNLHGWELLLVSSFEHFHFYLVNFGLDTSLSISI
jgi:hypothetical protein